jgi:putative hemolysin
MKLKLTVFNGLMICICIFMIVCGCAEKSSPSPQTLVGIPAETPAPQTTAGMQSNPASDFCEQSGGMPVLVDNPDGSEYGVCTFPNGTSCEEWALFRGEGCQSGGK